MARRYRNNWFINRDESIMYSTPACQYLIITRRIWTQIIENVDLFSLSKEKYLCLGINPSERERKKIVFLKEATALKPKGELFSENGLMKCERLYRF